MAPQKRPSPPLPMFRPTNGTRSESTRSPSFPSNAGSSVSAASTETMPTLIAPTARLFITFEGTSSIPVSAITKTDPLKSTARLEVAPAAAIAASSPCPPTRSSVARDDEERIVDPEREPHPGQHVHEEDRERERGRDRRAQAERDHDRDDRHQQRDEPGHHSAEHEDQDDQRRGETELELARLEVVLREVVE